MLCFVSPPPPAPPPLATSTFLTPSGPMKRPSLSTSIVQGARLPSSPAPTLSNLLPTTTCCTVTSCLSLTSPGISSRRASVSTRLRITTIPRPMTGSRTHLPSPVLGHHRAPQIHPTRPYPIALAPSCHTMPPPLDCQDPDGFASHLSHHPFNPCAPVQHIRTGGHHAVPGGSHGGMSPLTFKGSSSMGGGASVVGSGSMGGAGSKSSAVPLDIFSTSMTVSLAPSFVPLAQPSAGSNSSSNLSAPVPPPTTAPPVCSSTACKILEEIS